MDRNAPIKLRVSFSITSRLNWQTTNNIATSLTNICTVVQKVSIGTLSNLDDQPSGRRPEVFSRSRQLLRKSVMSSTWSSGRDICWFAVLRWTWAFNAVFDVSVPILPCLIPMFEKRKPFFYFSSKVGPLDERFREIFGKPWAVVFNGFGGKEPVSKSKMFMFSLNASEQ